MTAGVGIDAVGIDRCAGALARTPGLAARLFTDGERGASAVVMAEGARPGAAGSAGETRDHARCLLG